MLYKEKSKMREIISDKMFKTVMKTKITEVLMTNKCSFVKNCLFLQWLLCPVEKAAIEGEFSKHYIEHMHKEVHIHK